LISNRFLTSAGVHHSLTAAFYVVISRGKL